MAQDYLSPQANRRRFHLSGRNYDPTLRQRAALRLALALFFASGLLFASGWSPVPGSAPTAQACCSGTFYGADSTKMSNATQNVWPQASGPFCGIETAIAIANYADEDKGWARYFTSSTSQNTVASNNYNSSAESEWGYQRASGNNVAGVSNISLDFGTDPRSIAYMAYNYTPPGYYYHNRVYHWQMVHSTEPSYSQQVQEATTNMAYWLGYYGEPLSVAINAGTHSILVGGVWSTNSPFTYFPANITGITYRDPQDNTHSTWDIGTWTNGIPGGYGLWNTYYSNSQDPEPGVGPYKPDLFYSYNWWQGFDFISRDGISNYGPDWEYEATPGGLRLTNPGSP